MCSVAMCSCLSSFHNSVTNQITDQRQMSVKDYGAISGFVIWVGRVEDLIMVFLFDGTVGCVSRSVSTPLFQSSGYSLGSS